ncbi:RNA 3'-terminal phosphate cyclase [Sphingomonas aerophila]|uniref:RNA 3'-terminal phosphate cyclase n=1 Tax=Sphingomonas aerophila TaxID=1344948 RepID=A0A7W9BFT7_9SPHN|nr:RNA 3'-terminal phosphate cyclase [Sphingomonas aerophila]MBB5716475.1 RNA 3'-terminal phosphate cyclase (ATP) [Sphingomonas aerophila]
MITIDGSEGEGGGQVVRNACALSLVTGEAVRITDVRARRSKPGLMRQHVTAIEAACAIGGGECEGLTVGSSEVTFRPGRVTPGEYRFAVGTAGSTGLVLQTVLMPLLLAGAPSRLMLEGGTHNFGAPPFDFIDRVFLPITNRMGPRVDAKLVRHGFYPRGAGRIEVEIEPAPLRQIEGLARGAALGVSACALFAGLPFSIAEREIAVVRKDLGWSERESYVRELPEDQGPGNILLLEARFEQATEVVSGFGRLGVTAESLARQACARMRGYLACDAFAGPYLADQLLLPMAVAGGGAFTTVKPSEHARTAAAVIERFTGKRTSFVQQEGGEHLVTVA